jgi:predicted helicase
VAGIQIGERDKAIQAYYTELTGYEAQRVDHELALRTAFQNLLTHYAQQVKWTLIPELALANGARPDGVLRDASLFYRGYWEAKDTHDDLDAEIAKKIARGYPTTNIIFEDTRRAVLYQNGRKAFEADLRVPRKLADLLQSFFGHQEAEVECFEQAVEVFRERIPDLARELQALIARERQQNATFRAAFQAFYALCQEAIDPKISEAAVEEMLVQHLLTERLIRTIFNNPDFTQRNVIAQEIEKVIAALTSRTFDRNDFLKSLDPYYLAVEQAASLVAYGEDAWTDRQRFLNMVYERFFQGYSMRQADTHGIVYTPQEIVDFMVASADAVLKREFGLVEGIGQPGVKILDPATGTGSFIVNILRRIPARYLRQKYTEDLFCNEIMLLPYYIACLNIEHAYYDRTGEYLPFEGACFADTLDMAEHVAKSSGGEHIVARPLMMMTEANTKRVEQEQAADIMVVIGNPPYNVGQENETDNNKNRQYQVLDARVRETYVKDSQATNRNKLGDPYVKFFRWATDRLRGKDGILCLVTNNSFVDQTAFDGMRKHLLEDFTAIYHLDLHGNVRKNPKLSGTTHNVFGIQVGVGITIAVRKASSETRGLYYYRVPEDWRRERKLWFLTQSGSVDSITWQELTPDERQTWLTEGMRPEFGTFIPIGSKQAKAGQWEQAESILKLYSLGVVTNRDDWVYDFDQEVLSIRTKRMIETYNAEIDRWRRIGEPQDIDSFVLSDDTRIKWSRDLKRDLRRSNYAEYTPANIRKALFRPFTAKYYYFDPILGLLSPTCHRGVA